MINQAKLSSFPTGRDAPGGPHYRGVFQSGPVNRTPGRAGEAGGWEGGRHLRPQPGPAGAPRPAGCGLCGPAEEHHQAPPAQIRDQRGRTGYHCSGLTRTLWPDFPFQLAFLVLRVELIFKYDDDTSDTLYEAVTVELQFSISGHL